MDPANTKANTEAHAHVTSRNPATGEVVARVRAAVPDDVPETVRRARAAQVHWEKQPVWARSAHVRRLREVLYMRRDALAECVTSETGKPVVEALFGDVLIALDGVDYHARHAAGFLRERRVPHHNLAVKAKSGRLCYEPYGVIGIIAPWNYPLAIPLGQIVPALLAGNAVILKCSEVTPGSGELLAECFAEAEFPRDLVQVLQGGGAVGRWGRRSSKPGLTKSFLRAAWPRAGALPKLAAGCSSRAFWNSAAKTP